MIGDNMMQPFTEFGDLSDGEIRLVIKSVDEPDAEKGVSLRYGFSIIHMQGDEEIGVVYFAADTSDRQYLRGHISYGVSPAYSGHNYAAKACRLVRPVICMHKLDRVFIGAKYDNIASIRTIEKLGARLVARNDLPNDEIWRTLQNEKIAMYLWNMDN